MKTIRQQLTRRLLLNFTLLLGLGGLGVYVSTRAALFKEFDSALHTKAMAITTSGSRQEEDVVVDFPARFRHRFGDWVAKDCYQMWNTNGTVLERSESLGTSNLPCWFGAFREPKFWNVRMPSGFPGRAMELIFTRQKLGVEAHQPSASSKNYVLVVASDRRRLDKTLAMLGLLLAASGLLLLVATAFVVPRVLNRELAPLNLLANQAAHITASSLATRFPTETLPGELMPISSRLNDLLERLEQSFERERRFSADLAHELRTPIAELRILAEFALKWPENRVLQTDHEVLAICRSDGTHGCPSAHVVAERTRADAHDL